MYGFEAEVGGQRGEYAHDSVRRLAKFQDRTRYTNPRFIGM
jgi:hypothetical protein